MLSLLFIGFSSHSVPIPVPVPVPVSIAVPIPDSGFPLFQTPKYTTEIDNAEIRVVDLAN